MSELVEKMAKAALDAQYGKKRRPPEHIMQILMRSAESDMRAALQAIEEAGYRVVKAEEVERQWCLECGTVTRDERCHCAEAGGSPRLVNYADQLAADLRALSAAPKVAA